MLRLAAKRDPTSPLDERRIVLLNCFLPPPLPTFTANSLSDSLFVFSIEEIIEQVTLLGIGNSDAHSAHNIAHNKVMIVDGETVITGSFNFTKSGEGQNAENLVVIRDASIAATYLRNWNDHLSHSRPPGAGPIARDTVRPKIVAGQVVGNRSTRIFAWPGCATFYTMILGHRVIFDNRQAAESAGYHAAKNCPD